MRIRKEGDEGEHTKNFAEECFCRFGNEEMWAKPGTFGPLGQFRGKVVLLAIGSHIPLPRQPIDNSDEWSVADFEKKSRIVMEHATMPRDEDAGILYATWLNGTGQDDVGWITPCILAYSVNEAFLAGLGTVGAGLYFMDFPGEGIIGGLIERNPKHLHPIDGIAVSACSGAEDDGPPENIINISEQDSFKPAGDAPWWVVLDMGAPTTVGGFLLKPIPGPTKLVLQCGDDPEALEDVLSDAADEPWDGVQYWDLPEATCGQLWKVIIEETADGSPPCINFVKFFEAR